MPIHRDSRHERSGRKSISEIFVDREAIIRKYAEWINHDPPPERIMFLHGVGGIGKSSLLRFLAKSCSKRPSNWSSLQGLGTTAFVENFLASTDTETLPTARLNFGAAPHQEERPQEAFSAMFILKRQLSAHGVRFPKFDFAALTYLHKSGQTLTGKLSDLFPRQELSLASELVDFLAELPLVRTLRSAVEIIDARSDHRLTRMAFARGLDDAFILHVLEQEAEPGLFDDLPIYFAEDVNDWIKNNDTRRLILFFDTFEALWGSDGEGKGRFSELCGMYEYTDMWIRCLIGRLALEDGIIPVFAGRDPPRWDQSSRFTIPMTFVDMTYLPPLVESDALSYLNAAGITDNSAQTRLLRRAGTPDHHYHPHLLALCVEEEHYKGSEQSSETDLPINTSVHYQIIKRLLSYVDPTLEKLIVTLSVARWFDWELVEDYGRTFNEPVGLNTFHDVIGFSFISIISDDPSTGHDQPDLQQQRFEAHRLLRASVRHVRPDTTRQIHARFCQLFRSRSEHGNFSDQLELLYHLFGASDPQAEAEWCESVDYALDTERLREIRSLLNVIHDLPDDTTSLSDGALLTFGRALIALSEVEEAEHVCSLFATSSFRHLLRCEIEFCRGKVWNAKHTLERSLEQVPSERQGVATFRLAELNLFLGNLETAASACQRDIEDDGEILRQHWTLLQAEVEIFRGNLETSDQMLHKSVYELRQMHNRNRNLPTLAKALGSLGLVYELKAEWGEALHAHEESLSLRRASGDGRGLAASWHGLGKVLTGKNRLREADDAFRRAHAGAVDVGDRLLLGKVAHAHGRLFVIRGERTPAVEAFSSALSTFRSSGTQFDICHATLSAFRHFPADTCANIGCDPVEDVTYQAEKNGFGLLCRMYADIFSSYAKNR